VDPTPLIDHILDDEGLTDGLDEPEAILLVRALTDRVRTAATSSTNADIARRQTEALCGWARKIAAEVRIAKPGQAGPVLKRLLTEWPDRLA
jgi:hypothetical protein